MNLIPPKSTKQQQSKQSHSYQVLQSTESFSLGRNSSVPLPDGIPQRQSDNETQRPSCSNWPSGQRHPEKDRNTLRKTEKHSWFILSIEAFKEISSTLGMNNLGDRILGDTAHAPTSQCSCGDTDWHNCLGRSGPDLHSAHLRENNSHEVVTLQQSYLWPVNILLLKIF